MSMRPSSPVCTSNPWHNEVAACESPLSPGISNLAPRVNRPTISIVLPTFRRPELLRRCLDTLLTQTHPACEIIVGRREGDIDSAKILAQYKSRSGGLVRDAVVGRDDNLVASMNAALALSTGSLVALTDDDAEFPSDWLERMVSLFHDPSVGGAGGKDIQAANPGEATKVGLLQWFGRIIGNHHLGIGPVRDVDVLKGVNCCFRGDELRAIGFDRRLRGLGNVSNWELAVCFAFARQGYRLVFDPSLEIIHHTGPRFDDDTNNRGIFNGVTCRFGLQRNTAGDGAFVMVAEVRFHCLGHAIRHGIDARSVAAAAGCCQAVQSGVIVVSILVHLAGPYLGLVLPQPVFSNTRLSKSGSEAPLSFESLVSVCLHFVKLIVMRVFVAVTLADQNVVRVTRMPRTSSVRC